jgi:hypothetical protein
VRGVIVDKSGVKSFFCWFYKKSSKKEAVKRRWQTKVGRAKRASPLVIEIKIKYRRGTRPVANLYT